MAGTIAGKVFDVRNHQPIDGASVTAQPGDHTATTSGNDGGYSLSLPAGSYSMEVAKDGYEPWIAEGIFVLDDVATEIIVAIYPPMD